MKSKNNQFSISHCYQSKARILVAKTIYIKPIGIGLCWPYNTSTTVIRMTSEPVTPYTHVPDSESRWQAKNRQTYLSLNLSVNKTLSHNVFTFS